MTVISSPGPSQSKVVPLNILWITGQFNETDNHSSEYKECLSLRSEWCIGIFVSGLTEWHQISNFRYRDDGEIWDEDKQIDRLKGFPNLFLISPKKAT